MRKSAWVLLFVAACGGDKSSNNDKKDAAAQPADAAPEFDAPALIGCTPVNGTTVKVRQIGRVTGSAVLATSPPNDGRLFVIEQAGRIRIFENEQLNATPYLDVSNLISGGNGGSGNEQGLLGLAFHPNFANNRQFYVFYTTGTCPNNCTNVVAKYTQSATNPNVADATGEVILSIKDFATNHNGGMMEFGPKDGFLYIGTGDGGGGGDPCRNGQAIDRTAATCTSPPGTCPVASCEPLLGKILRIDVNSTTGTKKYGIPSDNPYAAGGGEPEIFITGVRNPWRWSFDKMSGDLYIGDVGQDAIEELTVLKAGDQKGKNLGWSRYEANTCYKNNNVLNYAGCVDGEYNSNGATGPQFQMPHSQNWLSIIGGQVYRGSCFPDLQGYYFFTDYMARPLVRGKLEANGSVSTTTLPTPMNWPTGQPPSSLHADARGELFLTNTQGYVYQIEAGP